MTIITKLGTSREMKQIKDSCAVCAAMRKLFLVGTSSALFTMSLFAYSAETTTSAGSLLMQALNLAITAGIFIYAVKVENRLTRLETQVEELARSARE